MHEIDQVTQLFNVAKFTEATDKLFRHDEEKNYKIIVARIHKFDELQSFFGKSKAEELLKVVAEGFRKFAYNAIKGRINNKAFAASYDASMVDEKKFIKELEDESDEFRNRYAENLGRRE